MNPDPASLVLMTPGPTRVPERVLRAGGRPMLHHRTPEFSRELAAVLELLGPVFGTAGRVLPVHTTGRGAMEATICNLFSPGDEIAVCCNGKFGEMWASFAESYGLVVHRLARSWHEDIDPVELEHAFDEHRRLKALALAFGDTSTGVRNDVEAASRVAHARGVLVLVDGVSSLGGMPFAFDAWDVDVAITASQKCLMSAPGLSFVAVSERGWAAVARSRLPRSYWDFRAIRAEVSKPRPETPGTPPVHIVLQVAEALRMMHEEGLAAVFARHETMGARTREGVAALGLTLQCDTLQRLSPTLTAVALPASITPRALRDAMKERGILTAAGLGPFAATAFRIGHMGDIRLADVERTLEVLAQVLPAARDATASGPAPRGVPAA
jgi:aspartate aminotransferase-like enzyme